MRCVLRVRYCRALSTYIKILNILLYRREYAIRFRMCILCIMCVHGDYVTDLSIGLKIRLLYTNNNNNNTKTGRAVVFALSDG